jgi:hypothetical protein
MDSGSSRLVHATNPIERAAVHAELARERAAEMRRLEAFQGSNSEWKERFAEAAALHERAVALQEHAVTAMLLSRTHPLKRERGALKY